MALVCVSASQPVESESSLLPVSPLGSEFHLPGLAASIVFSQHSGSTICRLFQLARVGVYLGHPEVEARVREIWCGRAPPSLTSTLRWASQ